MLSVVKQNGKTYMHAEEVGEKVFDGTLGFMHDLEEYSKRHKVETFVLNDETWVDCRTLLKLSKELKHTNTVSFLRLLRELGVYSTKRRFNQSHRIHVMYSQNYRCMKCHEILTPTCELDHVVALEDGGEDSISNLQALCVSCHSAKTYYQRSKYWS